MGGEITLKDLGLYREIMTELKDNAASYTQSAVETQVGVVKSSGDGVVLVQGLTECAYGELLEFENGMHGIAMNMEQDQVGAVTLDDSVRILEGSGVRGTGHVVEVPVGESLLGRVVGPLGNPLDKGGRIHTNRFRPIEYPAAGIVDRAPVTQPLETGLLSIDAMIPIGKGQRELIIGDRQTGKTAIALDTIANQKGKDVICVYVAIGQKASTIAGIVNSLSQQGALSYTVIVVSTASDPAPLQYIAPYAGCAIAEEFMYAGKDVLIVYDDLSKHAVAYRAMSLLLHRPPGREAYPGDVFYLHSRLLERAAKLSPEKGGGSMTALPIIETMAGDISSYIPTNVISITDGQIFLESELFFSGVRPAVNVGLSVSRVGGSAQTKAMRKVVGQLRLDLAQYREMVVFSQFSSELDKSTQVLLAQGARLTETLKQPRFSPMPMSHQVVLLYVVNQRLLIDLPLKRMGEFRREFIEYIGVHYPGVLEEIEKTGLFEDSLKTRIDEGAKAFVNIFMPPENEDEEPEA